MKKSNVATINPANSPRVSVTLVSPDTAEQWLGKNTKNRNIRKALVAAFARDMTAGKWALNGESIKFAPDGTLIDGQHRLHAVLASGATVQMLVVHGVPEEAMATVDTGAKRNYADVLKLDGEVNANTLASVVRRCIMWDNGVRGNVGKFAPTSSEMAAFLDEHPDIRESAQLAQTLASRTLLPASVLGLCHYLFSQIDYDNATWFLSRVVDEDVPTGHPARVLHRRITNLRISGGRIRETDALILTIRAWNAFRTGREVSRIQLSRTDAGTQIIPEPK